MKPNRYQALATFAAAFAIGGQLPAAPVPFDGGVTRVAPGIENKRFETVNGVLPVSWDPKASPYVELAFNRTTALPSFTHATVKMIFKAPAGTPVGRMGLRLLDAKGETFQYSIPVRQAADDTIEAVWQIAPDTEFISWGNNADKKLDQPVRINAVSFDYDRNAAPSEITLSSIEAETENAPAAGLAVALNAGIKKYVPGGGAPANYAYAAGKGVEVNWEPAKSKYIELVFNRPLQLPEFSKVSVTARIEAPAGCPVRSIGLRMTDKSNETFQFSKSVNFAQGGVSEVTWEASAGQWQNSWGGNNDKQLDQPMKVYGFGVDYSQNLPEASFRILSVTAAVSGGEKTVATRPLYAFNLSNSFNRVWGSGQPSLGPGGLLVNDIKGETSFSERMGSLTFFHSRPSVLKLDAALNAGNVKCYWVFRDAANAQIKTAELPLKQGNNQLSFNLTETLAAAKLPVRVERFALVNSGNVPGSVLLTGSTLGVDQPLTEAIDFTVLTGNDIHVLKSGQESALKYMFTNTSNQAGEFNISLDFKSFVGNTHRESFTAKLLPGEIKIFSTEWKPEVLGHWDVTATVSEASAPAMQSKSSRSFAYLVPAGPTPGRAPGFLFSVCTHSGRWSMVDQLREVEAAATCGVKVVRDSIEWGGIQPERGVWNFEKMDFLVNAYETVGIEHQAMFAFTAKWAATPERQASKNWLDWNRGMPELNAWREYVRTMADRYRGRIRFWEVWNEPDLGGFNQMSLEEYVQLQKATYEELAKAVPEAIVMTGGFATMTDHPGKKSPTFHRDYLKLAKGAFKVHAYHEHGSFQQFAQVVDEKFLPMRRETGTEVPWYANETAIHSLNGAERNQAITLFKKLLFAWSRGSIGYTWYDLRNDGYDPVDGEHNYGMVTNDFQPKPVYSAYNMLAGLYRNMKYIRQYDLGANLWAFEFSDGADTLIPAWDESGFGSSLTLVVKSNASAASTVDLMGNEKPQQLLDGMALLTLSPMPETLKLTGAASAEIAGRLLEVSAGGVAIPGHPLRFKVKVFNPLSSDRTFRLALEKFPKSFRPLAPSHEVQVPAGKTAEVEFELEVGNDFKANYGSSESLLVAYTLDGTPWKGNLVVPVNAAVAVPAGDNFNRKPDFVLNDRSQVVSITAADPALNHRVWRDANDLSAKIFLGEANGSFRLRADVTDDRHSQPFDGFNVWKGDNIQFAFQLPGQTGHWEIGLSRLDSGKPEVIVFQTPTGFDPAAVAKACRLVTTREGNVTGYDFTLPGNAAGMTPEMFRNGFRFNLLVNDNDGEGRDGWIHIAPGIGDSKNPDKFPFVVFE
ncbi:endo-1,4-beta-xylanase [Victivallis lenta]|uniref:endo-1,4-beta-xylanase n=1 Tax=Victivallis lenta TaxID=2606640 RepID=UPI003AB3AEEF